MIQLPSFNMPSFTTLIPPEKKLTVKIIAIALVGLALIYVGWMIRGWKDQKYLLDQATELNNQLVAINKAQAALQDQFGLIDKQFTKEIANAQPEIDDRFRIVDDYADRLSIPATACRVSETNSSGMGTAKANDRIQLPTAIARGVLKVGAKADKQSIEIGNVLGACQAMLAKCANPIPP